MAWAAMLWRSRRHRARERFLLLIVYLGISIGNHLLALLAVPGVLLFLVATLVTIPRLRPSAAGPSGARWRCSRVWALLVGTGLGSIGLTAVGAVFLAAAAYAPSVEQGLCRVALALAAVGVTPYLFLYHPLGAASADQRGRPPPWMRCSQIRRAQYPPAPFDDPTERARSRQPAGRWRSWAGSWRTTSSTSTGSGPGLWRRLRQVVTIVFLTLGLRGLGEQRRSDRPAWWLLRHLPGHRSRAGGPT